MNKILILFLSINTLLASAGNSQTPGYRGERFYVAAKISAHPSIDTLRIYPEELWNFDKWEKNPFLSFLYGLNVNYVTSKRSVFSLNYFFSRAGGIVAENPNADFLQGPNFLGRANFHCLALDLKLFPFPNSGMEAPLGMYFSGGLGYLRGSANFIYSSLREVADLNVTINLPCIRTGIGLQRILFHKIAVDIGGQVNLAVGYYPDSWFDTYENTKREVYKFGLMKNVFNFYFGLGYLIF